MKKEEVEKMKKQHEVLKTISKMFGESDLNFKMLATSIELTDKIQDLVEWKDSETDEKLLKQIISMLEQFSQVIDDFVKDNNLKEEDLDNE